jgi:hypothetical protein
MICGHFVADCCKTGKGEYPTSGFNYCWPGVEFSSSPWQYEAGSVLRAIFTVDDNFSAPDTAIEVNRSA